MASFWDLFNGANFYATRARYRREFFTSASAIVVKGKILCQLESSTQELPLSLEDKQILATHKDGLKKLEAKYLSGTLGSFAVRDGVIHLHRLGLRYFTDLLAEHKARAESGYAMDLISAEQIALWITQFILASALSFFLGGSGVLAVITSVVSTLLTILKDIQALGQNAAMQSLQYIHYTFSLSTNLAYERNDHLGGRKALQDGKLGIFQGLSNYANGERYKAKSPGSQTYQPSQPYTPSYNQTTQAHQSAHLIPTDESTQGRAHYTLAGNAGFMDRINPHIPLAEIGELENDLAFKQNALNKASQDLYQTLLDLSNYLGSNETYRASDFVQAIYDRNFAQKELAYHSYAQSQDFIRQSKRYNYALRADSLHYSIITETRKASGARAKLANPYDYTLHDFSDITATPLPPRKELDARIQLECYKDLKAQGLSDEKASALSYGSEEESQEQAEQREQALKQTRVRFYQRLDASKFTKGLKSFDLLTNHASALQQIASQLNIALLEQLQEHYTIAYDELLLHKVLAESNALQGSYGSEVELYALSVWVEFQMKRPFGDYFYRSSYGASPKIMLDISRSTLTYIWQYNLFWRAGREDDEETKELAKAYPLGYEILQARRRVWSSFSTQLWKITREVLHTSNLSDPYTQAHAMIQGYLHDTQAQGIYTQALQEAIQELEPTTAS